MFVRFGSISINTHICTHRKVGGWIGARGWGGEQCTMCRPGLFTVERLSLGLVSFSVLLVFFFFGVSFPVFTESGEEQHFLRG